MRRLLVISGLLLTGGIAAAQSSGEKPPAQQQQLSEFFARLQKESAPLAKAGNVLGQIQLLRKLRTEYTGTRDVQEASGQFLGTLLSFVGQPREAQAMFDDMVSLEGPGRQIDPPGEAFRPEPAVDIIVRAAGSRQGVFLNEAHHVPQHRLLTLALLAPLREKGYRYFAAETFAPDGNGLNETAHPTHQTGFYTNEPVFAQVVREAKRLNYILVHYEAQGPGSPDERERGQAANLKARIFDKDPDAKVLVHSGYAHIDESGAALGAPPMAIRFRELTKIDPLTVDQTIMYERTRAELEPQAYKDLEARHHFKTPTVFVSSAEPWTARPGTHDMTVFLPRTIEREGRPGWLFVGRRSVPIPADVCAGHHPCLVEARAASESADAVPIDALLIESAGPGRVLVLPSGKHRIEARDPAGKVLRAWDAQVQ